MGKSFPIFCDLCGTPGTPTGALCGQISDLLKFAQDEKIHLTVVGPDPSRNRRWYASVVRVKGEVRFK